MNRRSNLLPLACWVAAAALLTGCQLTQKPAPARSSVDDIDPCAERLHDICGHLLLYYSAKGQMPERLEELSGVVGAGPLPPLVCPASGKPYAYNPDGLPIPDSPKRAVVYDAAPTHSGTRWAIVADPSQPGQPLLARVLRLPEKPVFAAPK